MYESAIVTTLRSQRVLAGSPRKSTLRRILQMTGMGTF